VARDGEDETTKVGDRSVATPVRGLTRRRPRLVVVAGVNVGEIYPVANGCILGRSGEATIRIPSDDISRKHAQLAIGPGGDWTVEDLGSRNGTWVNGERVSGAAKIADGDKIELGSGIVLRFGFYDELDESYHQRMYESSLRDGLTRAFNRKYFEERLDQEFAYALRHSSALSLLMLDIDHFKAVNDTHGHLGGDAVLAQVAQHITRVIRAEDVFARYGGEEFVILSRGIHRDGAVQFAERVRASIERFPFTFDEVRLSITVSIGVAAIPDAEILQPVHLVEAADRALYRAKESRNRVA
jgi:diguanylate cyclase (GGDEF)-like protein